MSVRPIIGVLLAVFIAAAVLRAEERNVWPLSVQQLNAAGTVTSGEYLGPLLYEVNQPDGGRRTGFRPVYQHSVQGTNETSYLFYPFFTWQKDTHYSYFSFLSLINSRKVADVGPYPASNFDIWPFYFSRTTTEPGESYSAFFPFGGTIQRRLGKGKINFVLFPLYSHVETDIKHTTNILWPIFRSIDGNGAQGFEVWPLIGQQGRPGDYSSSFMLWPLVYHTAKKLSEPVPEEKLGLLPFYARETAPGYISETYAWPFFGYTHRTEPYRYDEQRYLWPFLVQGRGEQRQVNRWAPFYTHSIIKGYDKTWVGWPIFRHARWEEAGLAQEKNQFLMFVYWSLTQRSLTNPAAAPAHKTHVWPLLSAWDNGAGRKQLQLLSPLEVFFQQNEPIRQIYSPLFAIYRWDQRAPGDVRGSLLFSLVSWKTSPAGQEFHLGPLFSRTATAEKSRFTIGCGLLAWQRQSASGPWKFSVWDFKSAAQSPAAPPSS